MGFFLSKWYFDAVGEPGEVFIGYRAALRWRRLGVSYASILTADAGGVRSARTVRPGPEPDFFEGALAWTEPELDVSATWRGAAHAISRTLYESPEGAVVWNCVLPSAETELTCGKNVLRGRGYAEHLSMTIPPWRLPIDTLRWGRFLSTEHALVWIDWESREGRRTWVFVDGTEVRGEVSEEGILFEGGKLRLPLPGRLTLRDGRLSHLLGNLPLPLPLFLRALAIHETKWRTSAVLELDAGAPESGWAIHEIVRMTP
ncbi:MAG TPA: hypothetical protein VF554_15385 [Thermoanaerobaculia bacterium]|jgi:hypothetical protein